MRSEIKRATKPILKSLGCLGLVAVTSVAESTLTGGAIGLFGKITYDIVSSLSGDMLSNQIGQIDPAALRKAFKNPGVDISNHDLYEALKDALKIALVETAKQYQKSREAPDSHFKAIHKKMTILCEQIDDQFDNNFLNDLADDTIKALVDETESSSLSIMEDFLKIADLNSHGHHFLPFIQQHFSSNVVKAYAEILKKNTRVWIAYQRLAMSDIQKGVNINTELSTELKSKLDNLTHQLEMIQKHTVYEESKGNIDKEATVKIWSMFDEAKAHRTDSVLKLEKYHHELISRLSKIDVKVEHIKSDTDQILSYSEETITVSKEIYEEVLAHHELSNKRHDELKALIVNLTQELQSNPDVVESEKRERVLTQVPELVKNIIEIEKDSSKLDIVAEAEAALNKPNGVQIALLILDLNVIRQAGKEVDTESDTQKVINAYKLRIELLKSSYKYAEIIQCYHEVISLSKILKPDSSEIAFYYSQLGSFYFDNGEYDQAIKHYNLCIVIRKKIFGNNDVDLAETYNNIGLVYNGKEQYEDALKYYKMCLKIRESKLGINHPDLALTYTNLGIVYGNKSQHDEALKCHNKSKDILEKSVNTNKPYLVNTYNNIGVIYQYKGEFDKALHYYNMCELIQKDILDENHPFRATTYNNIGATYFSKGQYDNALKYYEMCKDVWEKVLSRFHPNLATVYSNIGLILAAKEQNDKAIKYFEMSKTIQEEVLGKHHLTIGELNMILVGLLFNQKEFSKALNYIEHSIIIYTENISSHQDKLKEAEQYREYLLHLIRE